MSLFPGYCYELFEIEHRVLFPAHKSYLEVDVLPYLPMLSTTINFPSELLDGEKLEDYEITIEAHEGITSFLEANFVWPAGTKEYLRVIFDKSVISRLVPLTPETTRALPITLQVCLSSTDRIISIDNELVANNTNTYNRTISNSSSTFDLHNQVLCTPLSESEATWSIKNRKLTSKNVYTRNSTSVTPTVGEEKSVISNFKRIRKGTSGSLTRTTAKFLQSRTPELLSKKEKGPRSSSVSNLLDEEKLNISAAGSRESLDSLGRDEVLKYVTPGMQPVAKRNSISVQDDFFDVASPLLAPSTTVGGIHRSVSQLSFNTVFQSKFSSFPEIPKVRSVEGEIHIKYSGELSYCKGYYRECVGKIEFKIKPSLLFGYFDIIPFPSSARMCSFCFSVFNMSKEVIKLTCSMNQKSVLDDLESNREVSLLPSSCKRLQIDIWKFHLAKPADCTNYEQQECVEYAQLLADIIQLKWTMLSTEHDERCGETSLQGFELTRNMLINLKSEPICYDVFCDLKLTTVFCSGFFLTDVFKKSIENLQVNDCIILPDDETKFLTGQQTQLSIILFNYTNIDIGPVSVTLKIYEDNLESVDSESTGKVTVWPTSSWTIDLLPRQCRQSITCNVIFFYHGTYKLRVICTQSDLSLNQATTTQGQYYQTNRHQVQELSYKMFTDMNQLYFSQYSHTKPLVSPKVSIPVTDAWSPNNFWLSSPYYTFNLYHKNFMVV